MVPVPAGHKEVAGPGLRGQRNERVAGSLGNESQQVCGHRADAAGRNLVVRDACVAGGIREGLVGEGIDRIVQGRANSGEIAGALRGGRQERLDGLRLAVIAKSLISAEDEEFVLDDARAGSRAELVLLERRAPKARRSSGRSRHRFARTPTPRHGTRWFRSWIPR